MSSHEKILKELKAINEKLEVLLSRRDAGENNSHINSNLEMIFQRLQQIEAGLFEQDNGPEHDWE